MSSPVRDARPPARTKPFMMANVIKGLQDMVELPHAAWRQWLATLDLTPEQLADGDNPIPIDKGFAAFDAAAKHTANPAFGIDYAAAFTVGGTGPLGFAAVNATTVREALQTVSRFMPLVATMQFSRYAEDKTSGSILWRYHGITNAMRLQFMLWGTAVVMARIAPAMPAGWKPLAVEFDIDAPTDISPYRGHFGPNSRFGQPINRLAIHAELLDRPPPEANARLFALMTRLAALDQERRGVRTTSFEAEARAAIKQILTEGRTSSSDLAAALGLDVPTLRKTLKDYQLEFRALIDDVRRESARSYLADTDVSITDIAFTLGYAESSMFTRACHKWFGMAPREMRARAQAK